MDQPDSGPESSARVPGPWLALNCKSDLPFITTIAVELYMYDKCVYVLGFGFVSASVRARAIFVSICSLREEARLAGMTVSVSQPPGLHSCCCML